MLAVAAPTAVAGSASWAHQAGSLNSNGAVTVKSLSGGSYAATQNPTGAIAKTNQVAVTQPPTVIIQATSNGLPFNYKDDCYIIDISGHPGTMFIGAGKIDAPSKFTGIATGYNDGAIGSLGAIVLSALTGASLSGSSNAYTNAFYFCGSDTVCPWTTANANNIYRNYVIGFSGVQLNSYQKCYP